MGEGEGEGEGGTLEKWEPEGYGRG